MRPLPTGLARPPRATLGRYGLDNGAPPPRKLSARLEARLCDECLYVSIIKLHRIVKR